MTLSSNAFLRMHKIKFLKIYYPFYCIKENYGPHSGDINVNLSEGFRLLPDKLKYLHWYQYPLNSLPSEFCPKNLVQLHLIHNNVERLFMGDQPLESLTFIDLSYSMKLIEIPDLSKFPKLEVLNLRGCTSLVEICSSIQYDSKLTDVDLGYCKNLCRFSSFLHLGKLNSLSLNGCSSISEFPKIPPSIKCLVLNEVSIQHVPLSIGHCSGLTELRLKSCTWLESLPRNIGELKSLERLDVEGCSKLMNLPDSICNLKSLKSLVINKCLNINELPVNLGNLKSLKRLRAAESGIKTLPSSINQLSQLIDLSCDGCKGLELPSFTNGLSRLSCFSLKNCGLLEISNSFSSLVSLARLYLAGNNLEELPTDCLEKLPRLRKLDLRDCRRLRHLSDIPSALEHVVVRNCESLKSISFSQKNMDFLMSIDAANCGNLDLNACTEIIDDVLLSDRPIVASHCSPESYDFLEEGKELHVRFGRGLNIVGGEVPPRMRYQNKSGSYLSYSLRPDPRHFIALAFCAVVAPNIYPSRHFRLVGCKCSFEGKSGHTIHFQSEDIIDAKNMIFQSEHVFFWSSITEFNFSYSFTKASFEFYIVDEGGYSSELIKKCGIHPFNDDDNDIDLPPSEDKSLLA
ncbi:disease resistance-like protein DSC1 [Mercurialis annua]|uniref:disease resistance-like protein DSC1 n=1 Tax=Mercurialis annua TaxID=3986 RepID=UPI00215EDDBF|nr:disease resistance-like protein DSC1 [Mercurialis annua]XP_050227933.1 disease resistance-like protein DSC1 [Mercurialis annua]